MAQILNPTAGAVIFDTPQLDRTIQGGFEQLQRIEQARQLQLQREAQATAKSWLDNEFKAQSGELWAEDLAKEQEDHIRKGEALARAGISYNSMDPQAVQYRQERRQQEDKMAFRKQREDEFKAITKNLRDKGADYYDPKDMEALQEFVRKPFNEVYEERANLPTVTRPFSLQESIKGIKPMINDVVENGERVTSIDRPTTERAILSRISETPKGQAYLNNITGGISPKSLQAMPNNKDGIKQLITDMYNTPSYAAIREQIAVDSNGSVTSPSSPRFDEFVDAYAQQAFDAKQKLNNLLDDSISQISGGIKVGSRPDFAQAREQRAIAADQRARQSHAMSQARFNERNNTRSGGSSQSSPVVVEDTYIPYGNTSTGGTSITGQVPAKNAHRINESSKVDIVTPITYNMKRGGSAEIPKGSIQGDIVMFADVPFGKWSKGQKEESVVQEGWANKNPGQTTWRKMALVRTGTGTSQTDILVPAETVSSGISKKNRGIYDSFINTPVPNTKTEKTTSTRRKGMFD
jgi:hypothetical protein